MMQNTILKNEDNRKRDILIAALKCFLQFGYAKTSMEDIAKVVNLSRPLIYLKFKNKEALYIGVIEHLVEGRFEAAAGILTTKQSKKSKLIKIYEILLLEPWSQIIGQPMSGDFYRTYTTLFHELAEKYQLQTLKCTQGIFSDKKNSEIFILAVEGLKSDLPDTATLRERLLILIEHFIP
jgi:AcrR family transcriptional regulator